MGWRTIETAYKDQRPMLMVREGVMHRAFIGRWSIKEGWWIDEAGDDRDPTHWMPLPQPPVSGEKS